jgi:hypothetical protein
VAKETNKDVTILVGIQFALYSTIIKMCTGSIVYDSNGIKSLWYRFSVHSFFQCNAANISKTEYLNMYGNKTKYMVRSTYDHRRNAGDLRIGNKTFKAVQSFQYLGNINGNTNNNNKCIKQRIMMGNKTYYANRQLANSSLISRNSKCRYTAHWYAQ